jgi:sigma-B regulation protein RsbU (phosphoserine phosphatase)
MLYNPEDKKLHFQVLDGYSEDIIKKHPLELGSGIAGWVAKHRISQLVDDCYNDKRFNENYDKISNFTTRNMVCVPIIKNDSLIGVISVINKKGNGKFVVEDVHLLETLAGQCAVAIENGRLLETKVKNESIKNELETARRIQSNLIQKVMPIFENLSIAAKIIPAQEVGGDYFSVSKLSEEICLFLVADVSGKGIPAALLVSTIDATLHTILKLTENNPNPKFITETINSVLCDVITQEKFATAWIGILETGTGKLSSINAGHNPPIIIRSNDKSLMKLTKGGIFLGVIPYDYEMEIVDFYINDLLVFFSDGVVEAMDKNNNLYTDERLVDLATKNRCLDSKEILDLIINDVQLHELETHQSDDITLGIVKRLS